MIHFRKPYSRLKEGILIDSIVAYGSHPYSYGDDFDKHQKRLYIDLWLITLDIRWLRKAPPTRAEKIYGKIGGQDPPKRL